MIAWLQIDGGADGCTVALVRDRQAMASQSADRALPLLAGLSTIRRPLSVPGIASAATSNMDAQLDNAGGELTALWGQRPPMRRAAQVLTPSGPIFDGVVTGLDLGAQASISLEAGMDRPLSDNVPLRTSTVWGGWRDVRVLPWGWGVVTITPIQYSDDQREFFLLDHPIAGVDEVKRDDVATQAFSWSNGVDSTGQAVSFLELAEPLADGEEGELVITTLAKEAYPMIRFRTGDITRIIPEPCPCGRTMRRIGRVLGRCDDMLIIRGVNVFPSRVESLLLEVEGVTPHYRIVLTRQGALDTALVQRASRG